MLFLKRVAIIAALFAVGLSIGSLMPLVFPAHDQPTDPNEPRTESQPVTDADDVVPWPVEDNASVLAQDVVVPPTKAASNALQTGDGLFEAGDLAAALKRYEAVASSFQGELPPALRLRLALCSESLGDSENALSSYRILTGEANDARIRFAAKIGLARVLIQFDRPMLARQVVWKCLREDSPAEQYAREFAHLLARIQGDQAMPDETSNLLPDSSIANPSRGASLGYVLSWVKQSENDSRPAEAHLSSEDVIVAQQLSDTPSAIRMDVDLDRMPLFAAFERIAEEAGIPARWSSEARETVAGRTIQVRVVNWDAATILDSLLDPHDLAWDISDDSVSVRTQTELSAEMLEDHRVRVAERSLRRAVTTFPEHRMTAQLYWLLGNLKFHQGLLDEAVANYGQLLQLFPKTPGRAKIHFNAAKAMLLSGRDEVAVEELYRAVDEGVGEEVVAAAYLFIGRSYLENDRLEVAVKPLARATTMANHGDHKAVATLALAGALLLLDNPIAANDVLMENRAVLRRAPYHDQAAFLASLARFRSAKGETQSEREGRSLIEGLSHVKASGFFGRHAYVVFGRAFRELELLDSARSVLREGLGQAGLGRIRDRIAYQLALCELDTGNTEEAKRLLQTISGQEGVGERALDARLSLARLAYDGGNDDQCLKLCSDLLQTLEEGNRRTEALRLMGQVYQRQGERRLAALCFSGLPQWGIVDDEGTR